MSCNGYIRISRDITSHWLWERSDKLKWWLDLIILANYEDVRKEIRGHLRVIHRGQMIASVSYLSRRWDRDRKTIISFLNLLEEDNMIKRETVDGSSAVITICNYDSYQLNQTGVSDTSTDTKMDTSSDASTDTNKRNNNISTSLRSVDLSTYVDPDVPAPVREKIGKWGEFWNGLMDGKPISKIISLSEKRKKALSARISTYGVEKVKEAMMKVSASNFCNGDNERNWMADFDWVVKRENFVKILEGKYDNKEPKPSVQAPRDARGRNYSVDAFKRK